MSFCAACGAVTDSAGECRAPSCPGKGLAAWIKHYCTTLGVNSLSHIQIDTLTGVSRLRDPSDLYTLETSELVKTTGCTLGEAKQALRELEATKSVPMSKVLEALGISGMTGPYAQALSVSFSDIWGIMAADETQLVRAVGMIELPRQIRYYFERPDVLDVITNLEGFGVGRPGVGAPNPTSARKTIKGKTVCFTGTLQSMVREEAHRLVTQSGGFVDKTVNMRTDILVAMPDAGATKTKKAESYGTEVWSENEFLAAAGANPMMRRR